MNMTPTAPPEADGWLSIELPFHPTAETPQVSEVRVRFTIPGKKGSLLVDDVTIRIVPRKEGK